MISGWSKYHWNHNCIRYMYMYMYIIFILCGSFGTCTVPVLVLYLSLPVSLLISKLSGVQRI